MIKSGALLWAGFSIGLLLMQSPVLECSLLLPQMTSSGVMKGLFCPGGSGRWLDPIPGEAGARSEPPVPELGCPRPAAPCCASL